MNRTVWTGALLVALLSACGPDVTLVPRVVGGPGVDLPPEVMRWQKRGQFGRTDPDQRKEDMIECGVHRKYNFESPIGGIGFGARPGETTEQYMARRDKFRQCMKDKDYVQLGHKECGTVKENRGICK